jgi:hypothetical protein
LLCDLRVMVFLFPADGSANLPLQRVMAGTGSAPQK